MNLLKIEKLDDFVPSKNMITKITKMNNVIEFISMQKKNNSCPIRKINKNQYVHISTGEIFDCNHIKNRSENLYGIKISTHELRDLINFNFSGGKNELWITLTFGKNKVYNPKELYPIFTNFIKRFRYHFSGLVIDYIYIPEPHEKGDWHIHLLLKANKELYIKNSELNKIWGYGFVKVNRLKDIDNIGAYVSAYLTNIKEGEETKKGARLHLYPSGHQLYRYSKGIKKPSSVYGSYSDAKKEVGSHKPTYKTTFKISSDDGFSNIIHKEYYNLKR